MAQTEEPQSDTGPGFTVVGIGASAGGFEAFCELLNSLPDDTGMAFVLIQHLDPHHASALAGLLGHRTQLPVVEVSQGTVVLPNRIYVIPPNANMTIARGTLNLTPRPEAGERYMPIDSFFRSLAEDRKGDAIGVVLSGAATDGTLGLRPSKPREGLRSPRMNPPSSTGCRATPSSREWWISFCPRMELPGSWPLLQVIHTAGVARRPTSRRRAPFRRF